MQVNINASKMSMQNLQISSKPKKPEADVKLDQSATQATKDEKISEADAKKQEQLEKMSQLGAKGIGNMYAIELVKQTFEMASNNSVTQAGLFGGKNLNSILSNLNYSLIGYEGKNILDLTPDEASALVSEDGFFGIKQTSERMAGFVIAGAGDDLNKLMAGFEGMKKGFAEAERMWGGKLPEISYKTMEKATEMVTKRINELGGNTLEITA